MREIKFRGQMVACKYWIYGDLVHNVFNGINKIITFGIKTNNCYPTEVYENTICEYIGLKDKNGKEIYEGDICRHANGIIVIVEYNDSMKLITARYKDNDDSEKPAYIYAWQYISVIGNIYENTELIK